MDTILFIIENDTQCLNEFDKIKTLYDNYRVVSVVRHENVIDEISQQDAKIIIVCIPDIKTYDFNFILKLTESKSDIPVIAVTDTDMPVTTLAERYDCFRFLSTPDLLENAISEAIEATQKGYISGVSLQIALQMIELESKTCLITVKSENGTGILFFKNGELFDAKLGQLSGKEAALEIVSWGNAFLEFQNFCPKKQKNIDTPLTFLLLEASRQKDEEMELPKEPNGEELESPYEAAESEGRLVQDASSTELSSVDAMDFDRRSTSLSYEDIMVGPFASQLNEIQKAFVRAIGPIAKNIFKRHVEEWARDNALMVENLTHLTDMLCTELDEEELIVDFRKAVKKIL
ncbi:MAG: DUF4388 domain-containing protein [Dissulfuribacterales bacterium]